MICSFISDSIDCHLFIHFIFIFFFSSSQLRSSDFNAVFALSIIFRTLAPSAPISFPVVYLSLSYFSNVIPSHSPHKLNDINVVFTFSISLIDFAPSALIPLSVIHFSSYFCSSLFFIPHIPNPVLSKWCSLSAFHSLLLLLHLQFHCLSPILLSFFLFLFSCFPSSSLLRFNVASVLFTLSISLIAFDPSIPISLSVIHSSSFFLFIFSFSLTL